MNDFFTLYARDGLPFWKDATHFRAGSIIVCNNSLAPANIAQSVALYEEWCGVVEQEMLRKAKKLELMRPDSLTDDLLHEMISAIVLNLLRFRDGKRVREESIPAYAKAPGVFGIVRRYTEMLPTVPLSEAECMGAYVLGLQHKDYQNGKRSSDTLTEIM
ncbi:hypothetical protein KKF84_22510 [Myxococcota bacterium]|nr:hypothetical protein [Myxococcota bacterium]MBU1538102.1 hypothetical protein [Myxococcota bacterium]